jgi:hypothetical protein
VFCAISDDTINNVDKPPKKFNMAENKEKNSRSVRKDRSERAS